MNDRRAILCSAALGAGLMYLLDPTWGKRRRALVRDKVVRILHTASDAVGPTARDLTNRTRGLAAETRALFRTEEVSDEVLEARVCAELGRVVSHPSAIEVEVRQGRVTLSGPILAREEQTALRHVAAVRGVTGVENQLEVHQRPGNVPGLQGGALRRAPRFELMKTDWSPATRLLAGVTGGLLAAAQRRDLSGFVLGGAGLALLTRGLTNIELRRLLGIGGGRRAVDVQNTITVAAPIEQVFSLWANYEYFPYFMSRVREVRDLDGDRSHWVVDGPAGVAVEWDALLTEFIPDEVVAWKSEPSAAVQHAGIIRFTPTAENSTRVHIRLSYNPPAGAIGHAVAWLFGADPQQQMSTDLLRMKTFIETGTPPHDAAAQGPSAGPLAPVWQ